MALISGAVPQRLRGNIFVVPTRFDSPMQKQTSDRICDDLAAAQFGAIERGQAQARGMSDSEMITDSRPGAGKPCTAPCTWSQGPRTRGGAGRWRPFFWGHWFGAFTPKRGRDPEVKRGATVGYRSDHAASGLCRWDSDLPELTVPPRRDQAQPRDRNNADSYDDRSRFGVGSGSARGLP
jgi:hypothetical protein